MCANKQIYNRKQLVYFNLQSPSVSTKSYQKLKIGRNWIPFLKLSLGRLTFFLATFPHMHVRMFIDCFNLYFLKGPCIVLFQDLSLYLSLSSAFDSTWLI